MSLKNCIFTAVAFGVLALAIVITNVKPLSADVTKDVIVANTPLPVSNAPTAIVFSGPLSLGSTPTLDVSAYKQIRVSIVTSSTTGGRVTIYNKDSSHAILLAQVSRVGDDLSHATAVIDLPGRTIEISGANVDGTTLDLVLIDGR